MRCGSSASAPRIAAGRWRSREPPRLVAPRQPSAQLGQRERQQELRDQLRRECLGRRDPDLGAGAGEKRERRLPHHRARRDVADRQRVRVTERLRVLQRRQRVGGFARLRDDDDQRLRMRHAVAIAVLARDLDRARHAGQRLDPLLRHEARVVARAAGEDQHGIDLRQDRASARSEQRRIDAVDPFERVGDRARLLEDLLLHEMPVRAELDGRRRSPARRRRHARRAGPAHRRSRSFRAGCRRHRPLRDTRRAA